jgi:hypothetical protein
MGSLGELSIAIKKQHFLYRASTRKPLNRKAINSGKQKTFAL